MAGISGGEVGWAGTQKRRSIEVTYQIYIKGVINPISLAVNSASSNESKTIADIGQIINRLLEMRLTTHDDNIKEARGVTSSRLEPIVIWGGRDDMQSHVAHALSPYQLETDTEDVGGVISLSARAKETAEVVRPMSLSGTTCREHADGCFC